MRGTLPAMLTVLLMTSGGLRGQRTTTVLVSSVAGTPVPTVGPGYVVTTTSHADINFLYNSTNSAFSVGFRNDDTGFQFNGTNAIAYAVTNQRTTVPAGSQWEFLGPAGGTFWSFPAALNTATNRKSLYLGFAGYGVGTNLFLSNRFNVRVQSIENLTLPEQGDFFGFETIGGTPVIRLSSSAAYTNSFSLPVGGHSHINLAFTTNGMFRVWLVASGTLLSTEETIESAPLPLYFGIEQWEIPTGHATYTAWRDAEFTAGQIADPLVSGPAADPDADGFANLEEYAFGGEPLVPDAPVLQPRLRRDVNPPVLTSRLRTTATDLAWTVQATTNLSPVVASWSTNGITPYGTQRPIAGLPGMVEVDHQLGTLTNGVGFGRVSVTSP